MPRMSTWVAPAHPISIHWINTFRGNAGVLSHAATSEAVPEFKDTIQLIWSAFQLNEESHTDNAVKDCRKQLQACVSANGGHSI